MKSNHIKETPDLAQLINKLRLEDFKYAGLSKRLSIAYWVITPLYFASLVAHIIDGDTQGIVSSVCYLSGMLIFALSFRKFHKEFNYVDYSLPTLIMLKKAAQRYKPFQRMTWWALVAVLFVDAGLSYSSSTIRSNILITQIYFLAVFVISFGIGLLIWKNRYKPLRDAAIKLIKEIEE